MMPTTRFLCPLDCGWHHDPRTLPDLTGLSGNTIEEIIRAGIERQNQADEEAIREHLESHPLIEWVTEVARLQRELNTAVATGGVATGSRTWVEAGPDCGFPSVLPRQHSADLQRRVAERFGFPLRTPATGGKLAPAAADIPLTSRNAADIEGAGQ